MTYDGVVFVCTLLRCLNTKKVPRDMARNNRQRQPRVGSLRKHETGQLTQTQLPPNCADSLHSVFDIVMEGRPSEGGKWTNNTPYEVVVKNIFEKEGRRQFNRFLAPDVPMFF